jgi:hypothetical protein
MSASSSSSSTTSTSRASAPSLSSPRPSDPKRELLDKGEAYVVAADSIANRWNEHDDAARLANVKTILKGVPLVCEGT